MNSYKLNNIIKKEFQKDAKLQGGEIKKQKFSYRYLRDLFNTYALNEMLILSYCCRGEDVNCWVDATDSWARLAHPKLTDYEFNLFMYKTYLKPMVSKKYIKTDIHKRNIFIRETEGYIVLCIPLRDLIKDDLWVSFNKTKKF